MKPEVPLCIDKRLLEAFIHTSDTEKKSVGTVLSDSFDFLSEPKFVLSIIKKFFSRCQCRSTCTPKKGNEMQTSTKLTRSA